MSVSPGCGATPAGGAAESALEPATADRAQSQQATASEFVAHLRALARAGRDAELGALVDGAFAQRLPSGGDLAEALRAVPGECALTLHEGPGYATVAIPPPMVDDSDEDAARIDALIGELRASTEVEGRCASLGDEGPAALFTIAVRRTPEGWRALAWRDHQAEAGSGRH